MTASCTGARSHKGRVPPERVVDVQTEESAQDRIDELYRAHVPINILGAGHLLDNRDPVSGGVRLANNIRTRLEMKSASEIVASTGWRWFEVVEFAERQGVSFPVLTSNLHTTVGGTLSAGGFGLLSHSFGIQADHVSGCTIHTARGTFQCSRSDTSLWRSALCSLGAIGFVSTVTLKARPRFERVTLFERRDSPSAAIDGFVDAAESFRHGACFATCRFEHGVAATSLGYMDGTPFRPPAPLGGWRERLVPYSSLSKESTVQAQHGVRRVWNDYILPLGKAGHFIGIALELLQRAERHGKILRARMRLLSIARALPSESDFYLKPQLLGGSRTIGVGFYLDVAQGDEEGLSFGQELHGFLKAACRSGGGAVYNSGEIRFSEEDCRSAFGGDWDFFKAARQRYDPAGLFGNGNTLPFGALASA